MVAGADRSTPTRRRRIVLYALSAVDIETGAVLHVGDYLTWIAARSDGEAIDFDKTMHHRIERLSY